MSDQGKIPTLTDLIEKGIEIKMSDLGLDDELQFGVDDNDDYDTTDPDFDEGEPGPYAADVESTDPLGDDPALEQNIRRILDEHLELAFEEIRLAIKQAKRKG